jgi:hypothetical protein
VFRAESLELLASARRDYGIRILIKMGDNNVAQLSKTLCQPMIPTIVARGFRSPSMSNPSPKSTLCPWPRQSKHLGATPYSGAIKCATIASQSDSSGGRHASSARFARSCGAPLDAVQSCSLYAVRATRTAAVATAGNSRPAGAQGDDRGLRIMGW